MAIWDLITSGPLITMLRSWFFAVYKYMACEDEFQLAGQADIRPNGRFKVVVVERSIINKRFKPELNEPRMLAISQHYMGAIVPSQFRFT